MKKAIDVNKVSGAIWNGMAVYYNRLDFILKRQPEEAAIAFRKYCIRACHNYAVSFISSLADRHDCMALTKYPAAYKRVRSGRTANGRVDVAWFDKKGQLAAVFEVDRGFRSNSLNKTLGIKATTRFIVIVGTKTLKRKFYVTRRRYKQVTFVAATAKSTKSNFR